MRCSGERIGDLSYVYFSFVGREVGVLRCWSCNLEGRLSLAVTELHLPSSVENHSLLNQETVAWDFLIITVAIRAVCRF